MRLTAVRRPPLRLGGLRWLAAALALAACASRDVVITMDDYQEMGTIHGTWVFGRPMWMVMPVPSFNRTVRIIDLSFETVGGAGSIERSDAQMLVLAVGPYNGLTLSYRLDSLGGRLVPLDKVSVKPGPQPQLALVARMNSSTPGCHEARLVVTVRSGDTKRTFHTRWYLGFDTAVARGRGEHVCEATPAPTATHT